MLPTCATTSGAKNSVLRQKMDSKAKINQDYVIGDKQKWKQVVAHFDIFGISLIPSVLPTCATTSGAKNSVLRQKMDSKAKINLDYVIGDKQKWKQVVAHFDIFGISLIPNVLPKCATSFGAKNFVLRSKIG